MYDHPMNRYPCGSVNWNRLLQKPNPDHDCKKADRLLLFIYHLRPSGINFALAFYILPDLYDTLAIFFEKPTTRKPVYPWWMPGKLHQKPWKLLKHHEFHRRIQG